MTTKTDKREKSQNPTGRAATKKQKVGILPQGVPKGGGRVIEASSKDDKLEALVTNFADAEKMLTQVAVATLQQLSRNSEDDPEALNIDFNNGVRCLVRIGEVGSKTGRSKRDGALATFCGGNTKFGKTMINGFEGSEIVINIWNLQDRNEQEIFNLVCHQAIHLYSELTAANDKQRDCNKAGRHRRRKDNKGNSFEGLVEQLGWLEVKEVETYVELDTTVGVEGKKKIKELGIRPINIGKIPAKAPPKAKRVTMICPHCNLRAMVPVGKHDSGEAKMKCMCKPNGSYMKAKFGNDK